MGTPPRRALLAALLVSSCSPAAPPAAASAPASPPATVEIPAPSAAATPAPAPAEEEEAATPEAAPAEQEEEASQRTASSADEDPEVVRRRILAGIRKAGPNRYEMSAEARDLLVESFSRPAVLGQVRVTPESRGNQLVGLRVFGVRPGEPFAALGFENGDLLKQINSKSMTTPEQALEAYAGIRQVKSVVVEIERKGKPLTLTYPITAK